MIKQSLWDVLFILTMSSHSSSVLFKFFPYFANFTFFFFKYSHKTASIPNCIKLTSKTMSIHIQYIYLSRRHVAPDTSSMLQSRVASDSLFWPPSLSTLGSHCLLYPLEHDPFWFGYFNAVAPAVKTTLLAIGLFNCTHSLSPHY